MTIEQLTAIYMINLVGVVLLLVLLMGNAWRFAIRSRENRDLLHLIIIVMISCAMDAAAFAFDGRPGLGARIIVYISNAFLYAGNLIMGRLWLDFVSDHVNGGLNKVHRRIVDLLVYAGLALVLLNFFVPVVFRVDENNVYSRSPIYMVYMAVVFGMIADSLVLYHIYKKKSVIQGYFPFFQFVIPVAVGALLQTLFYGISVLWMSIAVGLTGVLASLQNEVIFMDHLTGLYNHSFLDKILSDIEKRGTGKLTGIMIDMNDFKTINDTFGHDTGDQALIQTAHILSSSIGNKGYVIRYAGDEFIILLQNVSLAELAGMISEINAGIESFNAGEEHVYKLSLALGYQTVDASLLSSNDFLNMIDKEMYKHKKEYYAIHPQQGR